MEESSSNSNENVSEQTKEKTEEQELPKRQKHIIVAFYKRPKKDGHYTECLAWIKGWDSPEGAKFYVKQRKKGRTYMPSELEDIGKNVGIGISRQYKDERGISFINVKGEISHKNIERIFQSQGLLKKADVIQVNERDFMTEHKYSSSGTLYCHIYLDLYKLKPKPEPEKEEKKEEKKQEPKKEEIVEPKVEIKSEEVPVTADITPSN